MVEKKKFFEVEVPSIRTKVKLLAYNLEQLNNRVIKLDLTRQLRGKSLEAVIKVKVANSKAEGDLFRIALLPFFIRRMMRKSVSYVEDSFPIDCINAVLRIKPFLITRKKVTRAVRKALRENTKKYLEEYAKDKDSEEIFSDVLSNKLQKILSMKLKKIYPLALCEVRDLKVEKEKQGADIEKLREEKKKLKKEKEETRIQEEKSQIEEIEEQKAKEEKEAEESQEKEEVKEEAKE